MSVKKKTKRLTPTERLTRELFTVAHTAACPDCPTHEWELASASGHSQKAFPALAKYISRNFRRRGGWTA